MSSWGRCSHPDDEVLSLVLGGEVVIAQADLEVLQAVLEAPEGEEGKEVSGGGE